MVALSGPSGLARQQAPAPPATDNRAVAPARTGDGDEGKAVFVKYGCAECHGLEGQGSPTSGPRIGPNPLPLTGFMRYVRAPRLQMPPYTVKVVSDQDLRDIHAYLTSRAKPAPTPLLPPEK